MTDINQSSTVEDWGDKNHPYTRRSVLLLVIVAYFGLCESTGFVRILSGFTNGSDQTTTRQSAVIQQPVDKQDSINDTTHSDIEPYVNRWQQRFASSKARNKSGGYVFFKHIRKAGGTSLRAYFRDVFAYHGLTYDVNDYRKAKDARAKSNKDYVIHYVEHEFQTMDSDCPKDDPRWNESLRIVVLRHPIERHMSEFFFSGHGTDFPIDKQQLYTNQTYTDELSEFLNNNVPQWMSQLGGGKTSISKFGKMEERFNMFFGRYYTDNFQLRAFAGCSSGECLEDKVVADSKMEEINALHPSQYEYTTPVTRCTQFFNKENALFDPCAKPTRKTDECSIGCDGPCFYPSVAWGELSNKDVTRAVRALEAFDSVLLMETYDDSDQSAFLADILGVPRDSGFNLGHRNVTNSMVQKTTKHEKNSFYRDLLSKLSPVSLDLLRKENKLEIEFFEQAIKVNERKTAEWKRETGWHLD
jgi:hypothetical protein